MPTEDIFPPLPPNPETSNVPEFLYKLDEDKLRFFYNDFYGIPLDTTNKTRDDMIKELLRDLHKKGNEYAFIVENVYRFKWRDAYDPLNKNVVILKLKASNRETRKSVEVSIMKSYDRVPFVIRKPQDYY